MLARLTRCRLPDRSARHCRPVPTGVVDRCCCHSWHRAWPQEAVYRRSAVKVQQNAHTAAVISSTVAPRLVPDRQAPPLYRTVQCTTPGMSRPLRNCPECHANARHRHWGGGVGGRASRQACSRLGRSQISVDTDKRDYAISLAKFH